MSDSLPEELCYDILIHVPAEPLFRFRSVCKTWCRIIDNIAFIKMHLDKQEGGDHLIIRNINTGIVYLLPLSSIDCSKNNATTVEVKVRPGVPMIPYLPLPSNSGFILIDPHDEIMSWTLWNPFTRESILLPDHDHLTGGLHDVCNKCCGNGYDSATDDFKVVRIVKYRGPGDSYIVKTLIYSLKSNHWKIIPNLHDRKFFHDGVFVKGALHWITNMIPQGKQSQCIIAFDLNTEEDRELPCPSFLSLDKFHFFTVGELGGCLSLRDSRALWIMKDYEENVWTKLVSFEQEQLPRVGRSIAYIKRKGQVVFNHKNKWLWLFDVEKKCAKRLHIRGVNAERFTCQVFPTSLFRLNRSGGGDGSIAFKKTLKRKRQTANNRLKVELKISDC